MKPMKVLWILSPQIISLTICATVFYNQTIHELWQKHMVTCFCCSKTTTGNIPQLRRHTISSKSSQGLYCALKRVKSKHPSFYTQIATGSTWHRTDFRVYSFIYHWWSDVLLWPSGCSQAQTWGKAYLAGIQSYSTAQGGYDPKEVSIFRLHQLRSSTLHKASFSRYIVQIVIY